MNPQKAQSTHFRLFIAVCLLTLGFKSQAQLVNIESKRMQTDSTRFILNGHVSFNSSNNDGVYIIQALSNITTQFKSKNLKKIYFLVGDYNLIRSEGKDFTNVWFVHLRYNQELTNLFRIEGFLQSQHNKILDVNLRNLAGVGIRLKLFSKKNFRLYWGNAYMYENEINDELNLDLRFHRLSSYMSMTAEFPNGNIGFYNTIYYQPLFKKFGDFRILNQFKADVELNKHFNVFALFDYFYDSITPKDRSQYSSTLSFGFGIRF